MAKDIDRYFRQDKLPHIWCSGCGHGTIMSSMVRAIDEIGFDQDKTVIVSGIGCSGRAPGYLDFNTLHVTHGRAITYATGVKMANPELEVIVVTGDGDGAAIGGNHLIHGCRRNIDINVVLFNNNIYGMTAGQFSPQTPTGCTATTAPYGNIDQNFDLCGLARSAGATFVARSGSAYPRKLNKVLQSAFDHDGFSFVEAMSQCPVNFGRRNDIGNAVDMLRWQKDLIIDQEKYEELSAEEQEEKLPAGILYQDEKEEYTQKYDKLIKEAKSGAGE